MDLDVKKEEMEAEKKRLMEIRNMALETKEKIKRLEEEHTELRLQQQKKLRNLRNIQSNQEARLGKLTNDIKLLANSATSRRDDLRTMEKVFAESTAELKKIKDDTDIEVKELKKKIEELEGEVKQGYVDLQNEKELQVLLEVGFGNNFKEDDRLPLTSLESIIRKRQENTRQRQNEIQAEITRIESEQVSVEEEIKQKQEELLALKDTYLDLLRFYKKTKSAES